MNALKTAVVAALAAATLSAQDAKDAPRWLDYPGSEEGVGAGKRVVFIAAEQEYRAEQSMPMMARLLAERHGFHTTVLFGQRDGLVDSREWQQPGPPVAGLRRAGQPEAAKVSQQRAGVRLRAGIHDHVAIRKLQQAAAWPEGALRAAP